MTQAMVKGGSETVEIPRARFYITATDSFMSGWGPAEGKRNVIVLPSDDYEEAKRVFAYVQSRGEMRDVQIREAMPPHRNAILYSLITKENGGVWYRT